MFMHLSITKIIVYGKKVVGSIYHIMVYLTIFCNLSNIILKFLFLSELSRLGVGKFCAVVTQ